MESKKHTSPPPRAKADKSPQRSEAMSTSDTKRKLKRSTLEKDKKTGEKGS